MTATRLSTWLDTVATVPDLPPAAVRIAVAVAAHRSADLAALVERLNITREEADASVAALVAAGFVRTRLEPAMPPGAPRPAHLSPQARRALAILGDLDPPCSADAWRAAVAGAMPEAAPDARRQSWHRARRALVAAGLVSIDADGIVTMKEPAR